MIAISIEGRLGNQLFQYAFIYCASKKLNTGFYIDTSINKFILPAYFDIETDHLFFFDKYIFSITGFKNIFHIHARVKFYQLLKKIYGLGESLIDNTCDPFVQTKNIRDKTLYKGFFQSENYFIDCRNTIIDLFSIKKIYKQQFENVVQCLPSSKKFVTVHIRRGDYLELDYTLSADYFHDAIKSIHTEENYYIFISDDFDYIKKEFSYIENKYLSDNSEIIDFQFLGFADICILSNSSFSWWGAYLSKKKPTIIAPENWLGKEQELPVAVLPDFWIKAKRSK